MIAVGLPIVFVLVLWWASTGAILWLDGLAKRTFAWSMGGATALLLAALWGLWATAGMATPMGAVIAFACGLMVWAWHLVSFYMGFVTGPRTTACEPGMRGLRRFVEAVRTSLWHELTVIATSAIIVWLLWDQPNRFGAWTILVLWWMHASAKLNIFFGVPNLGETLLPDHLGYLESFMTRRPMNLFFPLSVTASTIVAILLVQAAAAADASPFDAVGYSVLATLMVLAIGEHWFLVVPVPAEALWAFGVKAPAPSAPAQTPSLSLSHASVNMPQESGYERAPQDDKSALESWSTPLPVIVDQSVLSDLLDGFGAGSFGDVDCIRGVVKTTASWIRFEADRTRAHLAVFVPNQTTEALVTAIGRRVDHQRLRAAFEACAVAG